MPSSGQHLTVEPSSGTGTPFPFVGRSPAARPSETVLSVPRRAEELARGDSTPSSVIPPSISPLSARLFPAQIANDAAEDLSGVTLGHFRIEQRIGMGGMGTVFLATDERLQRPVALKILSPSQLGDPASIQRFQNEARAAARLDHDHVARVFFYGEEQGLHFIAFEYVQGKNLRDIIRARGRLEPAECVSYVVQLAAALCHTSACGVVHRDIKPSNIIITPQGKAKLVDLGLARKENLETSAHLTVAGTTLGTFDYIAPEQAKDPRNVDVRSDIYALGGTLYHMLTGELPYPEGTVLQRLLDHQEKDPPDPALRNRRVPPGLSAIVKKMLAADPRRRYLNAEDLLRDLLLMANALGLQPIPSDSAVMAAWSPRQEGFWAQHGGWISAAVILLIAVGLLQAFPDWIHRYAEDSPTTTDQVVDLRPALPADPTVPATRNPSVLPPFSTSANDLLENRGIGEAANELPITSVRPNKSSDPDVRSSTAMRPEGDGLLIGTTPGNSVAGPLPAPGAFDGKLPLLTADHLANPPSLTELLPQPTSPSPFVPVDVAKVEPRPGTAAPLVADAARVAADAGVGASEAPGLFQVLGTGKSYATLEAACAEARDQTITTTIELNFDGRLPKPESPLRLRQKRLVIQAARGRRPIITFAPASGATDPALTRMLSVSGGTLSIINVGLELKIPDNAGGQAWSLICLARPERLRLQGVTATVINPRSAQTMFVEFATPLAEGLAKMGTMKEGSAALITDVGIDRCLFRGEGVGLAMKDSAPLRCEIKDSLFGVSESLVTTDVSSQTMQAPGDIALELNRSSFLLGGSLVSLTNGDELSGRTATISITSRHSVISCPKDRPLLDQLVPVEVMEFRKSVKWVDEANVFDDIPSFWSVRSSLSASAPKSWDFLAWKSYWGGGEESRNLVIPWRHDWRREPWSEISKDDARFDSLPENLTVPVETPGAPLDQLPLEPAVAIPAL